MTINFLFFENYETLDIFGPIEILARIDGVKNNYVSMQGGLVKSRQGFAIQTSALLAKSGASFFQKFPKLKVKSTSGQKKSKRISA